MPEIENGSGFIVLSLPQEVRSYTFPGDQVVNVYSVTKIKIASDGYHYLETSDGNQHVVAPGWISMSGTPAPWVFQP